MAHVRHKVAKGSTLMSRMFPDPLEYASRLLRLNYVHPTWWTAYKASPPKDVYKFHKIPNIKLPVDRLIRKTFEKIPMLRKEKYEHANPDYSPLAVRFALTQQRLMDEENYSEEDAFDKCEHEIFKEELYVSDSDQSLSERYGWSSCAFSLCVDSFLYSTSVRLFVTIPVTTSSLPPMN